MRAFWLDSPDQAIDRTTLLTHGIPNEQHSLEAARGALDRLKLARGYIEEDDTQTSVPNIYAIGDITENIALVNVGELEGRLAVERICESPDKKLNYDNLSSIMFLNPEVAAVGMNEQQALEKKLNFRVVKIDYSCIARAIALQPEVLLMDEPCSALDPRASAQVEELIRALAQRFTVVVVTHNLHQARRVSDYAAIFWQYEGQGQLVEAGPTEVLFGDPQHTETRAYVQGVIG
jgi:ABC-type histidine transport system ATPase subunit